MTRNKKLIIGAIVLVALAGLAYANLGLTRTTGTTVNTEKIQLRSLEAIVTASGKVQPRRTVKVSNEAVGKILKLLVREGDMVKAGQVLAEIDPTQLQTTVENREASLASVQSQLSQMLTQLDNAKIMLSQSQDTLKRAEAQMTSGLISREQMERAQNDVKTQTANVKSAEQGIQTQRQRIKQEEANLASAQIDFTKVRVYSPLAGVVTQRLIEEGEMARYNVLTGGTDLLAIADMSAVQAEIEVDETDIPFVRIGQPTKVKIDAIPDQEFPAKVSEVGNSPITTGAAASGRATNFLVKVLIEGVVPNVRPGFTCTAVITTATRDKAIGVPIQAMTVREMIVDKAGNIVKPPVPASGATPSATPALPAEPKPGETRKEIEGVFLLKDGHAVFTPVKVGIAGEKYFEVLSGLKENDEVITGPPTTARMLKDGEAVKVTAASPTATPAAAR